MKNALIQLNFPDTYASYIIIRESGQSLPKIKEQKFMSVKKYSIIEKFDS